MFPKLCQGTQGALGYFISGRDKLHFREILLEADAEDNRRDQGMSVEGVVMGRVRGDEGES